MAEIQVQLKWGSGRRKKVWVLGMECMRSRQWWRALNECWRWGLWAQGSGRRRVYKSLEGGNLGHRVQARVGV